jgi:subtilisin family serine protease
MEEKEYAVVIKDASDFDEIHALITTSYGDEFIPARSVDIANYRPGSDRITHYSLTDAEAEELRKHPKIQSVEIPPHLNPRVEFKSLLSQTGFFTKTSSITSSDINWGLLRSTNINDSWGSGVSNVSGSYNYTLTGKGVDVVILDSGITVGHPEWNDSNGNSRLQQINWYTASGLAGTQSANHYLDYNGHGSHCAGIAAGLTQGWARNSRIYAVKSAGLAGSEGGGISSNDIFDVIRLWHNNKPIDPTTGYKRPTVVNMSFGLVVTENSTSLPATMQYRGTTYTRGTHYNTLDDVKTNYGWMGYVGASNYYYHSYYSSTYEAEVQDMINAGIHVVVAGGNNNLKIDVFGGDDYNNRWGGYSDGYYHRGGCPGARYAIVVGNISVDYSSSLERRLSSSETGPGVHIYAPGTHIMSVSSKDDGGTNEIAYNYGYTAVQHPIDSNYNLMKISGTSMAAPQVVGMLACILEAYPTMTPAQAKTWLINNSVSGKIYDTGTSTSYNTAYSLVGGNNRYLYNPFNRAIDGQVSGGLTISNGVINLV